MKLHSLEFPTGRSFLLTTPKLLLPLTACVLLLTLNPLLIPPFLCSTMQPTPPSAPNDLETLQSQTTCDIFNGEWVPNHEAPYYTNTTCRAIHEHENCMMFGRPDTDFMKWRWKPNDCELPIFNPSQFLELMRGKSMAFVGDSVARNQMQSLICLLSRVEYPVDTSLTPDDRFKRWSYTFYNFTISSFWSPYLVKAKESDPNAPAYSEPFDLHLDAFDSVWTTQMAEFDYVILSAGQWFFRKAMYYESSKLVGCYVCQVDNITDLGIYYGYRKALRTAFRAFNGLKSFKGMTFLRTFSPAHFENGLWNQGAGCVRKRPFMSNESRLDGYNLEFYMTQVEEFRTAEREGKERGLKFRLLDTTQASWLRPDGHPGRYRHWSHGNVSDCVHWCLPGPIDAWNDLLMHMLKMEVGAIEN